MPSCSQRGGKEQRGIYGAGDTRETTGDSGPDEESLGKGRERETNGGKGKGAGWELTGKGN